MRWFLPYTEHYKFAEMSVFSERGAFQALLRDGEHNSFSRTTFIISTDIQLNKTNAGKSSLFPELCVSVN